MKNERTVVIDNGSSLIKVGFSGDGQPSLSFPAVVGRYKVPVLIVGMGKKDYYIGEEAFEKQGILCLTHPIEGGFITNWDDMAKIWHHCFFHELRIAPEENPTLLTEGTLLFT
jgi:actin